MTRPRFSPILGPVGLKSNRHAILTSGTRAFSRRLHGLMVSRFKAFEVSHPGVPPELVLVIHGTDDQGIPHGADMVTASLAAQHGYVAVPMPYCGELGPAGGPSRNNAMVALLDVLRAYRWNPHVWAFPDDKSTGTPQLIRAAKAARFDVLVDEVGKRAPGG